MHGLLIKRYRLHFGLFIFGLLVYGLVSGDRLGKRSEAPHFVVQATAWLNGQLNVEGLPKNDRAAVETVETTSGRQVRGRRLSTRRVFRTTAGENIPLQDLVPTPRGQRKLTYYNSFPPFPAVLMLPQAVISGAKANDVLFTVFIAALILPLFFATLRRLHDAGLSDRTTADDLWLVAALAFGTILFYSAVQGTVWYTAHVVGVFMCVAYVWCSIEARHPLLAGICLGCAALTRTPMAFMFPLILLETWRTRGDRTGTIRFLRTTAWFAAPIVFIGVAAMLHNYYRFDSVTEFGHSYLEGVFQLRNIEQYGLASLHYLPRNVAIAGGLLPEFSTQSPFVTINPHGMALWFTTPILLFLLWPRLPQAGLHGEDRVWTLRFFHRALWITAIAVALPALFYQNSGWFQFGYRFSLDYMVFLLVLLAVGRRPLTRTFKTLLIIGIAINLFGAMTFQRHGQFYKGQQDIVIRH